MNELDAISDEVASTLKVGTEQAKDIRIRTWHEVGRIMLESKASIDDVVQITNIRRSPLRDAVQFAKQHPDIERFLLDNPQLDNWTKIRKHVKKM